jgi:hypothetical protein
MAKVSHKQRIIDLIELNKSDVEIKKTIYNEYNIVVKLSDIEAKRNTNYIIEYKENKDQEIDNKLILVKEILNDYYYNPLTKKEIVNKVNSKYNVYLTQIEVKKLLWSKLRNEIDYDRNDWTYRLKNKIKNDIDEIENLTLNKYLKNNISDIIKELFGKIQFSLTVNFSEEFLYNEVNDIHDFDFHNELCFEKLKKIVIQNYNLLKKTYNIIQNIPSIVSLKNEIIENDDDINETDLNNFTNTFNSLFEVDEEKIRIKNNFFFNQTKDELEFLYEAYEKYYCSFGKKNEYKNNEISISSKDDIKISDNIYEDSEKMPNLLNELNNPINSVNLIIDSIKNPKIINDNNKVNNYLELLLIEIKKIEFLLIESNSIMNTYENTNLDNDIKKNNSLELEIIFNILKEEKYRLGSPVVNQFVENVTKRIKDLK